MALGNLAGLYGILEGISAGTDIQRQQQELQQRQQLFNQEQAQQRLQGQALAGLLQRGQQGGGIGQPQPMIPPSPLPQVPQATAQMNAPGGGLPGIVAQLESGGGRDVASQPPSMADPTYGQYPGFVNQYGRGAAGVNRFAQAELAAKPDATLGDYYSDYVLGTGKPGTHTVADLASTNVPGAQGAYGNLMRNAGVPASTPLVNLLRNDSTQAGMAALRAGVPQPAARDVVQTGQAAINELDPKQFGIYSLPEVAQAVEKASGPDTDPVVKSMAIGGLMKLLQPQDQMYYRAQMQQNRDEIQMWKTRYVQSEIDRRTQSGQSFREQQTQFVQSEEDRRAAMRAQGGGTRGGGLAVGKQYEYTDKDGTSRQVMLREDRSKAGYVDALTGQPFRLPEGAKNFKQVTASVAGGGRAGAQVQRQLTAGPEIALDLENVKDMPVGTTIGALGDVKPGSTIFGTLQGDLARQLTDEDEANMQMAMAGVGRELTTLMNPVYGGRWASDQLEPLLPRAGRTVTNMLYAFARIKQTATNALDSLQPSPMLNEAQKEYARGLKGRMEEAIPWSVKDVQAFIKQANPRESFGEFVQRKGIAGAEKRQGQPEQGVESQPVPDSLKNEPDGTSAEYKGKVWVKRGNQMIATPGAVPVPPGSQ